MKIYSFLAVFCIASLAKGQINLSIKPRLAYTAPLLVWYDQSARTYHKSIGLYPINNKGSFRPALSVQLEHGLGNNWSISYGFDYNWQHYRYEDSTFTIIQLANGNLLEGDENRDMRYFHYVGAHVGINYCFLEQFSVHLDFFVNRLRWATEKYATYRDGELIWEGALTWRWNWHEMDYIRTWDAGFRLGIEHRLNTWLRLGVSHQISVNPVYINTRAQRTYHIYHQSTSLYLSVDLLLKKKPVN